MDEKKEIEIKLNESEARFRSYFNMPLNGIAITSPEKGWIEVNDKVCSMLGYTREEILKMTWKEMTHPEDIAADEMQFNRLISGEIEQYNLDKRFIRKDKSVIWTNLSVGCVRKTDGSVDYIIALIVDITDRKKIEKELSDQNLLMKAILENAPIGFAVNTIDDGKAVFISKKFEEIYGVEQHSINSTNDFFEKVYLDPIHREEMRNKITADMTSGDISRMKWDNVFITTRTGENKYVTAINIPLLEQNIMVSTVQDVTDRKLKEDTLKEKLEDIEKMNKLMIGRELKMSEIKEADELLKEQISKQSI
jgi:PAS domain S-box-containing protein